VSDAAALVIFCGLVFVIGAIHARRKLMRRTAIGRGGVENVRTSTRNAFAYGETRNRIAAANSCGATREDCGGCPRGDGSQNVSALATPIGFGAVRYDSDPWRRELKPMKYRFQPLDIAAAILVPAIVFLCWALLTLLVIAHERETEQRDGREAETESFTRT